MMTSQIVFWATAAVVTYLYVAYPALLFFFSMRNRSAHREGAEDLEPSVSVIIAAHDEETVIADKIRNTLALDYPGDRLEITVVSDGSSDRTAELVRSYTAHGVALIDVPVNEGKASAQNRAAHRAIGDILLFTDANVHLPRSAVRKIVNAFRGDHVGCVVGKVTYLNQGETGVSDAEGFYWRYELFLRELESRVGNLAMGSGPIMALRRDLFEPLDPAVSEDFFLPMRAALKGYRTVFVPDAVSTERLFQVSPRDMFSTKVRTITLDTRGLFLCRGILNPFRYPLYSWGLVSHKLLRWLVPYFLIVLFAANLLLLDQPFYRFTIAAQILCYALAGAGYLWQRTGSKPPRILGIPFSFCLVNAAAAVGVARFLMGKKAGRWEPVREAPS